MNIHEYQAKDILRKYGVAVLDGRVATTPDEAEAAAGPYCGLVAPPTYVARLRPGKMTPAYLPRFGKVGFDAGRDVEIFTPVRPGDRLKMVSTIHDIYEKTGRSGSMYFIVVRNEISNQTGAKVATVDHRIMQR